MTKRKPIPGAAPSLSQLFFGKDDAETDIQDGGLLRMGFMRTTAYDAALSGKKNLIIGRKGSGKSAICLMLEANLRTDGNVCLVTPDEISADEIRRFELQGIPKEQSKALLWRYIFVVQIAKHLLHVWTRISRKQDEPKAIKAVRDFLAQNGESVEMTFSQKFWRVLERIKASIKIEAFGVGVSAGVEHEHANAQGIRASAELDVVEEQVGKAAEVIWAANKRTGLTLLVDQLEKVWSNDSNSDLMVIGLLLAYKHVKAAFRHVNVIVFLRTDIYDILQFQDRDKFRGDEMRIDWKPTDLIDLIYARAEASAARSMPGKDIFERLFPPTVRDTAVLDYLVERTLLRPRDIIQFSNACRDIAEKNGRQAVSAEDVLEATTQYSNWKQSDLTNEWKVNYPFLTDLFVLFSNSSFLISREAFESRFYAVANALKQRFPEHGNAFLPNSILQILYNIGFVGVVRDGNTAFFTSDQNTVEPVDRMFVIHPAFRDALRSTSAVAVAPYSASLLADRFMSEFMLERSPIRSQPVVTRGSRPYREFYYIDKILDNLEQVLSREAGLPSEVREEIRANLTNIRRDATTIAQSGLFGGNVWLVNDWVNRASIYFMSLRERLVGGNHITEKAEAYQVLSYAVVEVQQLATHGIRGMEALE